MKDSKMLVTKLVAIFQMNYNNMSIMKLKVQQNTQSDKSLVIA